MSSKMFFKNEREQELAQENPKLFLHFCALTTKLSFEEWFNGRQFVIDTIHSFDKDACSCSYYSIKCNEKCRVLFLKNFIEVTDQISSFTDEKLLFFDLMFLKPKVDSCNTHSVPLAERYLMEDDDVEYFC